MSWNIHFLRRAILSKRETQSAIALILALGLLSSTAYSAENGLASLFNEKSDADTGMAQKPILLAAASGDAVGADSAQVKSTGDSSADGASSWTSGNAGGLMFGGTETGSSLGQQSVTTGYELGGSGIASGRAAAQQGAILTSPVKGRPIRFYNGLFIYFGVTLGVGRNSNVLGANSNQKPSLFGVLRPELVTELKTRGDRYTLSYLGNYTHYASAASDDFNHHEFWAAGDNYFTSRARLGWGVGYLDKTDPRGSTDRAGGQVPDRWHAPVFRVLGIYGAQGSIGRIEGESSVMRKRYDNNRNSTAASDVDLTTVSGRFFYRFMPRTSLVLEARNTWANYVLGTSTNDNTDTRLYAGLTWDATAKTTGTIKVGQAHKNFNDGSRKDGTMGSWEGSLRWSPLTYSTFDLLSSRTPADSTGVGNFTVNTGSSLAWNHKWASYISSRANVGLVKTQFSGDAREDRTTNYGVGFFHEVGYRARVGLDWNRTDRNSNIDTNDFKRDVTMATLELVL